MIKKGSEFSRKTNNKETMQILELIRHTSLGYARYLKLLGELFWRYVLPL